MRRRLWEAQRHAPDVMIHREGEVAQDIHAEQACAAIRARQIPEDDRQVRHTESLDRQATDRDGRQAARATRGLDVGPGGGRRAPRAQAIGGPHGQQGDRGAGIDDAGHFQTSVDHHQDFNTPRAGGKSITAVCGPPCRACALVRYGSTSGCRPGA